MDKIYHVDLTESERSQLIAIIRRGTSPAYRIRNAQILLNTDINAEDSGPPKTDAAIASYLHCTPETVANVRKRFAEEGFEGVLERKPRATPPVPPIFDGEKEARLITLACSSPPEGRSRWTLQLLADTLVELKIIESVSPSTVCRVLKKRVKTSSVSVMGHPTRGECGVCRPDGRYH